MRLLARLAVELYYTPAVERRAALSAEAVEMARRLGDRHVLLVALHGREWATLGPDRPLDERIAACNEILDLAHELGQREVAYEAHFLREMALLEDGRIADADADVEAADHVAEQLRMPSFLPWIGAYRAMRAVIDGRFEDADQLAQAALDRALDQQTDPQVATTIIGAALLVQRVFRAGIEEALPWVQALADDNPHLGVVRCMLPFGYREMHCLPEARAAFEAAAVNDFADLPRDANWLVAMWALALSCGYLHDTRRAGLLYGMLAPFAGRWITSGSCICFGPADIALGILAGTLGRYPSAARHFDAAVAQTAALPAPGLLAHARHEYAAMLMARDQPGDRQAAHTLLEQSLISAHQLGMTNLVQDVEQLGGRLPQ